MARCNRFLLFSAWALAGHAIAFTSTPEQSQIKNRKGQFEIGQRVLRPELSAPSTSVTMTRQFGAEVSFEVDRSNNALRVLTLRPDSKFKRLNIADGLPAFEQAARNFLEAYRTALHVDVAELELDRSALVFDRQDQFLKFRVRRHGLAVQDALVDVRFKQGALVQIVNQSFSEATADARASLKGLDRTLKDSLMATNFESIGPRLRVISTGKGYRLVKVETYTATIGDQPYTVQIEAATANVFEVTPQIHYVDGSASADIYPRYYADSTVAAGIPEANLPLSSGGSAQTGTRGEFSTATASDRPSIQGLTGTRIQIDVKTGTPVTAQGQLANNQWQLHLPRQLGAEAGSDKHMAQAMIYGHLSRVIHHARKYVSTPWFDRQLIANANLQSVCNAHWDGTTVNFYSAGQNGSLNCANTGLIADVVYHEWGHGLDANTGGIEDGAYSEGIGDIMSLLMTRSHILGIGFTLDGQFVRDLEPNKRYPEDKGAVHSEGLIIGGTFYDLFKTLRDEHGDSKAIDLLSNFAFKSIVSASKYTDVYHVVIAADDDDANLANGTPNFCAINEAFSEHGLAQRAPRCQLGNFIRLEIDDSAGNGNGFLDPGETAAVYMHVHNVTGEALIGLSAEVSTLESGGTIEISDSTTQWADLAIDAQGRAKRPFLVTAMEAAPCGAVATLHFQLTANGRTVAAEHPVMLGQLLGKPATYKGANLPLIIKDNATVQSPITVPANSWPQSQGIFAANLLFDIDHTYVGDLTVWVQDPSGQRYEVYRGSGTQKQVRFDKDILNAVRLAPGAGEWALVVRDSFVRDEGTLHRAELTLTPAHFTCGRR